MPAAKGKAKVTADPEPAAVAVPSLADDIAALEASIAADQARLAAMKFKATFQEFPKMVKEHVFNSRAEQDAAGPEFADA